MSSEVWNHM